MCNRLFLPVNGHSLAFNRFVWLPKTGFPKIWPTAKLTQALGVTFLDSFICEHGFAGQKGRDRIVPAFSLQIFFKPTISLLYRRTEQQYLSLRQGQPE